MQRFTFPLLCLLSVCAHAHEGHGIEGASHYHASDIWGFVMALCVGALVWWFKGRGK